VGIDATVGFSMADGRVTIFAGVDHATAECLGIHVARRGTQFEALEPVRRAVHAQFGSFAENIACGVRLRHDHGSQCMSDEFQAEIALLGIESSPAFVREPEGNGCIERFFRTLKDQLLWLRDFTTLEELAEVLEQFRQCDNDHWVLERLRFESPRLAWREASRPRGSFTTTVKETIKEPRCSSPRTALADPLFRRKLCQNSSRGFWHTWLTLPGLRYLRHGGAPSGREPSSGESLRRTASAALQGCRCRFDRLLVAGLFSVLRLARNRDVPAAWQLSRGAGSLCQWPSQSCCLAGT